MESTRRKKQSTQDLSATESLRSEGVTKLLEKTYVQEEHGYQHSAIAQVLESLESRKYVKVQACCFRDVRKWLSVGIRQVCCSASTQETSSLPKKGGKPWIEYGILSQGAVRSSLPLHWPAQNQTMKVRVLLIFVFKIYIEYTVCHQPTLAERIVSYVESRLYIISAHMIVIQHQVLGLSENRLYQIVQSIDTAVLYKRCVRI